MFESLLIVHILAVVAWMGGGSVSAAFVRTARGCADPAHARVIIERVGILGARMMGPASIVTLLSGLGLVAHGPWGFGDLWVAVAIAWMVVGIGLGAAFHGPTGKRALKAFDEHHHEAANVVLDRWLQVMRVEMVVLVLLVVDMVLKPGT